MEVTGEIYKCLPVREGSSQRGAWKVASYVLKTEGNDPHFITFDVFDGQDERIKRLDIQEGKRMTVYFDIRAHEYNGRWFNQIRAYDARDEKPAEPAPAPAQETK